MRGVHLHNQGKRILVIGSSPHARGPPIRDTFSVPRRRIIPACAGSTRCLLRAGSRTRDHPRMRGVH